jgi:hypothetical protein
MASELRVNTLKDAAGANSVGMAYVAGGSAKHWANFNGSTMAVNDSFNQSSVTDNGTGDYSPQLTSSMSNDDYSLQCNGRETGSITFVRSLGGITAKATGQFRYGSVYVTSLGGGSTAFDSPEQNTSLVGDLA